MCGGMMDDEEKVDPIGIDEPIKEALEEIRER